MRSNKKAIKEMFTDVYETMPWNLREQLQELEDNIRRYPQGYSMLDKFEPSDHSK
jgi:hypothetical protein